MHALIVGGDYVQQIIEAVGADVTDHWSGRSPRDLHRALPTHCNLVVVLTNYVSHSLRAHAEVEARSAGVDILFCKRTVADVRAKVAAWRGAR